MSYFNAKMPQNRFSGSAPEPAAWKILQRFPVYATYLNPFLYNVISNVFIIGVINVTFYVYFLPLSAFLLLHSDPQQVRASGMKKNNIIL